MKKISIVLIITIVFAIFITGCSKKEEPVSEPQEETAETDEEELEAEEPQEAEVEEETVNIAETSPEEGKIYLPNGQTFEMGFSTAAENLISMGFEAEEKDTTGEDSTITSGQIKFTNQDGNIIYVIYEDISRDPLDVQAGTPTSMRISTDEGANMGATLSGGIVLGETTEDDAMEILGDAAEVFESEFSGRSLRYKLPSGLTINLRLSDDGIIYWANCFDENA